MNLCTKTGRLGAIFRVFDTYANLVTLDMVHTPVKTQYLGDIHIICDIVEYFSVKFSALD